MVFARSAALLVLFAAVAFAGDFSTRFEELRSQATPAQLYALLYDLPKGGDLHNHAGGSNLPEWIFAVLTDPRRNGGDRFLARVRFAAAPDALAPAARFHTVRRHTWERFPPERRAEYVPLEELAPEERQGWLDSLRLDAPGEGREEFFDVLWSRLGDTGRNLQVRTELLVENLRAFGAEGVLYLETQFSVANLARNDGSALPPAEAVAFVRARLAQPDVLATGVTVRFQESVLRYSPRAETALREAYRFVRAHPDLWVGLNLVGIEERGPGHPRRFLETFRDLRREGPAVPLALHAGEMDGADSHVRDTLLLGATRLGHAVNLIQDPDTLLLLQQSRRVLVEVNLISNRLLEYVPDLRRHPFPEYLRTGVPVALGTDDRGMWDSNLTDEYFTALTTFALTWDEVVALGRNSLVHAFVEPSEKARLLARYEERVAAFAVRHGAGSVPEALDRLAEVRPVAYGYARRTWGLSFPP